MESSAADLPALQQQHDQLSAQMEECERLAALNSELRLISHNMEELQEEQVQLKPQAELAQELRRHNQQLEQEAAHLPSIKVRYSTVGVCVSAVEFGSMSGRGFSQLSPIWHTPEQHMHASVLHVSAVCALS
jgi:hypothetical protein